MHRQNLLAFSLLLLAPTLAFAQKPPADHAERMKAGIELFRSSIRAALNQHCAKCHGGEKTRAGFDLTSRERLLKGGDSGAVIDLEQPAESYLMRLIQHADEPTMPPSADKLPDALLADFQRWIELGAPYDKPLVEKGENEPTVMRVTESDREFWSFRPLSKAVAPDVDSEWPNTDSDRFIFAKLHQQGLVPNSPADDRSRIRRAYLDLLGLPPTIHEIEQAMAMSHEQLVDMLLQSPHYGERWARHWLDAARFGESHGFEQDYNREFAYHYRDFVIKALNQDMPWDQFVRWQIAGDEIAPDEPLALMATGFLGAGVFPTQLTEKEFESARYDELDDMGATVGTSMLGLTVGCARCHDHKFDPLPVEDYYRFISTFTTTIRSEIDVDLDPHGYESKLEKWRRSHQKVVARRDAMQSNVEFTKRFETWLKDDAQSAIKTQQWQFLSTISATSSQQATTLTPQSDGAILASGEPPAREAYTVTTKSVDQPIRFLRVEALTHPSMRHNGPGRAGNGNFALSDFAVFVCSGDKKTRVQFKAVQATHQQNETSLSAASAVDDEFDKTGWAVDFGGIGKDQAAVFELQEPIRAKDAKLEVRLRFSNNIKHSLGRFRLSVSSDEHPDVIAGVGSSTETASAIAALTQGKLTPSHRKTLFQIFAASDPEWEKLAAAVRESESQKPAPSTVKVQVTSEGFPPTKHHADGRGFPHFYPQTHFLDRGDPSQKKGVANTGYLQVLMRGGKTSDHWHQSPPPEWTRTSYRRTGMANWITDEEHGAGHLLARVVVNRLWHHHFGRGIVATPNDFGLQGTRPTHPGLLDYLANKLIAGGWRLKPIHREILLSATWLQSKQSTPANQEIDPENKWFWRYPTRRLEAEAVRDAMLFASGQLDEQMFGPGTLDEKHRRRSIYFMIKRSRLIPMMQIFDQPEPLSSQGRRPSTTIAPQALLFMNNPEVVKWASAFAKSVEEHDTEEAIKEIYLRTLSRQPTASELSEGQLFVDSQADSYSASMPKANHRRIALADLCQVVFGLNEFIYLP